MEEALEPIAKIEQRVGKKKSSIYAHVKDGTFPQPIIIGGRNMWLSSEINAWIAARVAESRKVPA